MIVSTLAIIGFALSGMCGVYRLLRGPALADRIMALDVTLMALMGTIVIDATRRDDVTYLPILVVLAIVGFTATVAASRFLEHEGPDTETETFGSEAS